MDTAQKLLQPTIAHEHQLIITLLIPTCITPAHIIFVVMFVLFLDAYSFMI